MDPAILGGRKESRGGALSHPRGRVLALPGRYLPRKPSKVSRAALKDGARGSCMLMACGAARPPARAPGAPLQQGGDSGAFRPATALGSSSRTLLSPRHWGLVSSLEPLVNLRSGSGPPSGTTVPQSSSKSLFRKVCTSRVQTWVGGEPKEMQCKRRTSSEILTPHWALPSPFHLHPTPHAPLGSHVPAAVTTEP